MIFDLLLILLFLREGISKKPCHREHNMLIKNSWLYLSISQRILLSYFILNHKWGGWGGRGESLSRWHFYEATDALQIHFFCAGFLPYSRWRCQEVRNGELMNSQARLRVFFMILCNIFIGSDMWLWKELETSPPPDPLLNWWGPSAIQEGRFHPHGPLDYCACAQMFLQSPLWTDGDQVQCRRVGSPTTACGMTVHVPKVIYRVPFLLPSPCWTDRARGQCPKAFKESPLCPWAPR